MRRTTLPALAALLLAGACAPRSETAVTATVDTVAVRAGLDSLRSRYIAAEVAGDAAGLTALFTEDAGIDLYGVPRLRGRANIQAAFQGVLGMRKTTVLEINSLGTEARTANEASELGTFHALYDSSGVKRHEWGRYLAAFARDSVNQWRLAYLIGFPDSTKVEK